MLRSDGIAANTPTHIFNAVFKKPVLAAQSRTAAAVRGLRIKSERCGSAHTNCNCGHANISTTQRYIDMRPAMLKAAVEFF
jgi:integrase/recombinase XerD